MKHASIYYALSAVCLLLVALSWYIQVDVPVAPAFDAAELATRNVVPPSGDQTEVAHVAGDLKTDVIVVGAGISGLSAALELGRAGVEVTVLDMASVFGGHAVMSQGGVCVVQTPTQSRLGIEDSPDLAYDDFIRWGEDADADWVRYYVDHSKREIYDWLTEMGVEFASVETAPGNTVDRFHQPSGRGVGLVTPIYRECLELTNIHFVWNTKVEQLLNIDGRVSGVMTSNTRTGDLQSRHAAAVILATGGFQSNLEMVREFWPAEFRFPDRILAGSGRNSVGHGHRLAQRAGADFTKMDHQWNYFTGIPDPRYPDSDRGLSAANMYGIIVNPQGRRFANLLNWAKEVMPKLLRQDEATLWFVFDEASKPKFVVSGSDWADFGHVEKTIFQNPGLMKSAATVEELAEKAGLPAEQLAETIRSYNAKVDAGEDTDFARFTKGDTRAREMSPKIATPPFYAMQAFPLTRKSMGGVGIDLNCRVLGRDERAIPGLYAVGELTGLAGINGKAALEGTFLGPCIVTGRVAARAVRAEIDFDATDRTVETQRCMGCHDMEELLANPRPGYWHFEKVHKQGLERGVDCRHCHGELAPYEPERHRTNQQSLAATCVQCHVAQE